MSYPKIPWNVEAEYFYYQYRGFDTPETWGQLSPTRYRSAGRNAKIKVCFHLCGAVAVRPPLARADFWVSMFSCCAFPLWRCVAVRRRVSVADPQNGSWSHFYTPVWRTDALCRGNVCPSVRPSAFSGLFFNMLWYINLKLGIYIQ